MVSCEEVTLQGDKGRGYQYAAIVWLVALGIVGWWTQSPKIFEEKLTVYIISIAFFLVFVWRFLYVDRKAVQEDRDNKKAEVVKAWEAIKEARRRGEAGITDKLESDTKSLGACVVAFSGILIKVAAVSAFQEGARSVIPLIMMIIPFAVNIAHNIAADDTPPVIEVPADSPISDMLGAIDKHVSKIVDSVRTTMGAQLNTIKQQLGVLKENMDVTDERVSKTIDDFRTTMGAQLNTIKQQLGVLKKDVDATEGMQPELDALKKDMDRINDLQSELETIKGDMGMLKDGQPKLDVLKKDTDNAINDMRLKLEYLEQEVEVLRSRQSKIPATGLKLYFDPNKHEFADCRATTGRTPETSCEEAIEDFFERATPYGAGSICEANIKIAGYASHTGTPRTNHGLAEKRRESILTHLAQAFEAGKYEKCLSLPVISKHTPPESNLQDWLDHNRRVEIEVTYP